MKKINEVELKQVLKDLNKFKMGAYLYFDGIFSGRITFNRFFAKLDNKKCKIILEDKLRDDIIEIDRRFISLITKSEDNKKLQIQIESEQAEQNQTIIIEI